MPGLNCFDYAKVVNMPQYSYNNIIIIATNLIILEFLSTRFVHPGALLRFSFFYHELENESNKK